MAIDTSLQVAMDSAGVGPKDTARTSLIGALKKKYGNDALAVSLVMDTYAPQVNRMLEADYKPEQVLEFIYKCEDYARTLTDKDGCDLDSVGIDRARVRKWLSEVLNSKMKDMKFDPKGPDILSQIMITRKELTWLLEKNGVSMVTDQGFDAVFGNTDGVYDEAVDGMRLETFVDYFKKEAIPMAEVYVPSQYQGDTPVKKLLYILRAKKVLLVDRKQLGSSMKTTFAATIFMGIDSSKTYTQAQKEEKKAAARLLLQNGNLSDLFDDKKFDLGEYKTSPIMIAMRSAYQTQSSKEGGSYFNMVIPKDMNAVYQRAGFTLLKDIKDTLLSSSGSSDILYDPKLKPLLDELVDEYGKFGSGGKTLMGLSYDSYSKHIEWVLNNQVQAQKEWDDNLLEETKSDPYLKDRVAAPQAEDSSESKKPEEATK